MKKLLLLLFVSAFLAVGTKESAAASMKLDKVIYKRGTPMTLTVTDVTPEMVQASAHVVMADQGWPIAEGINAWRLTRDEKNVLTFTSPGRSGAFELRLFSKTAPWTEGALLQTLPFTVNDAPSAEERENVTMKLDKSVYKRGTRMTLTVLGVTQEMVDLSAHVTMAEAGAEIGNQFNAWRLTRDEKNVLTFTSPNRSGVFELNLFTRTSPWRKEALMMTVPFTVSDVPTPEEKENVTMTLDKEVYKHSTSMTLTVLNVTQEMVDLSAHVTMADAGTEIGNQFNAWRLTRDEKNVLTFTSPNRSGVFELNLFTRTSPWRTESLMRTMTFRVTDEPTSEERANVGMSIDKKAYMMGAPVTVSVTGVTQEMVDLSAHVTIAEAGAEIGDQFNAWRLSRDGDNNFKFDAPKRRGNFELNLFTRTSPWRTESLMLKIPFSVGDAEAEGVNVGVPVTAGSEPNTPNPGTDEQTVGGEQSQADDLTVEVPVVEIPFVEADPSNPQGFEMMHNNLPD
ncbi:hypothetical protein FACS1894204_01030 [Synergistales bacterium]|nr:hypothetical protein FACS1894204_01030 [Synergistales bacterium]